VQRGGGIVRVRPDGTELEVYCHGLRNPFDIAIDPFMNLFTRDNTNDGAGWDTRVSLLRQTALMGYTQLFANFTDEILPTLATFGGGGGTGSLFIQDPRWPEKYRNTLFTGDWGRSEVYRHELKANVQDLLKKNPGDYTQRGVPTRTEGEWSDVRPEAGSVHADAACDRHGHRRQRAVVRGELAQRLSGRV
jgi:hypothetical protein